MMQYIGLGAVANDATGDKLRIAGDKINDNFLEISGKALTGAFRIIQSLSDFPTPVANLITLDSNTTYFIINPIDTLGNTFYIQSNTSLRGSSSTVATLYSSIATTAPFLAGQLSIDIYNLAFEGTNIDELFYLSGDLSNNLFFNNCTIQNFTVNGGVISDYNAVIFTSCTFEQCNGIKFDGAIGTLAFDNCLGIPTNTGILFDLLPTLIISRRYRTIYSSFVCSGTSIAIRVNASVTIPDEGYILDTVNFSGASTTYIAGLDQTSNKALFVNCRGINNTAVIGQAYMQGNATATVIAAPSTFVKVAGTTTAGGNNSKYLHSNNRLTCDAVIERKFLVICQLSFTSGNNQACEFGFYDSTIAGIRPASRTITTTSGAGVSENVSFTSVISQKQLDYLEVHCANNTAATNITVQSMNFIITEIK